MCDKKIKIKQIEIINSLMGKDRQISPDSFDILWDLEIDELMDIRFQLEGEAKLEKPKHTPPMNS